MKKQNSKFDVIKIVSYEILACSLSRWTNTLKTLLKSFLNWNLYEKWGKQLITHFETCLELSKHYMTHKTKQFKLLK